MAERLLRILNVVGTRPNFVKIAPLMSAYRRLRGFAPILVHTGQHYDDALSGRFFRDLGIPLPDANLGIAGGSQATQTAEIMKAFEPVVLEYRPDAVLVVGDVNGTLACALVAAKPFAGGSGMIPICGTVRLTTDMGMLRVDTTDLERGFSTWVGAMVDQEGGICVSHKKLTDFVRTLPSDRLDLEVTTVDAEGEPTIDSGSMVLNIRSGDTEATVSGLPIADFPAMVDTKLEDPKVALFDPDRLAINIRRVQMVAAKDDSRPILTGIMLKFDEDGYEMAAADGFRLAIQRGSPIEAPTEDLQVVISARTFTALEKLLKNTEDPVRMNIDQANNRAQFEVGKHLVIAQLMAGAYPNYSQLVPDNLPWQVQVDTKDLKGAVESAAVYAVEGSNIIRFWVEQHPTPEDEEAAS